MKNEALWKRMWFSRSSSEEAQSSAWSRVKQRGWWEHQLPGVADGAEELVWWGLLEAL